MPVRICVFDRNPLEQELIARILSDELEALVDTAGAPEDAIRAARRCDVLIGREPPKGEDRLVFVRRLLEAAPEIRLILLEARDSLGALVYLEAGAAAFLPRATTPGVLVETVRAVLGRYALLSPAVAGALVRRVQELSKLCVDQEIDIARCERLTSREQEVAGLLSHHRTNDQIAGSLEIALGTAKSHVHNVLRKLDVETRNLAGIYWRLYEGDNGVAPGASNGTGSTSGSTSATNGTGTTDHTDVRKGAGLRRSAH